MEATDMMYEDDVTSAVNASDDSDVFSTDLPVNPPTTPDAHRGEITGVSKEVFESGATAVKVALRSTDVPTLETEKLIFLPRGFVNDVNVTAADLPEEEGNKQQSSFRIAIANSDGTATLQQLRMLCKDEAGNWLPGRSPAELGLTKHTDIDSFVENHNKMLSGLAVVFTRRPDNGADTDPRFKNRLRVSGIFNANSVDNPKFLKKGGYRKEWEQ